MKLTGTLEFVWGEKMKEIGGYFELEQFAGQAYHDDLLALNNGRSALLYLLKARNIKKLYLPYFLCDSVSNLCDRYGYEYEYYHIDSGFYPIFNKDLMADEWLYIVNFYGQISNQQLVKLQKQYKNIIFDNIHAFFQKPVPGIDTIYSCRKFFGVPDGGYLATEAVLEEALERDVSKDRMRHILGRYEGSASDYYKDFKDNDHSFVELPMKTMSKLTQNLMRAIDYETVRRKRNKNYAALAAALDESNSLDLIIPDGPYCYPYYCEDGMRLKRHLADKKLFIATLWPNVLKSGGQLEIDYAENILPLPCDQRYDLLDMKRILELIAYERGLIL